MLITEMEPAASHQALARVHSSTTAFAKKSRARRAGRVHADSES
jgi:hypothetical protein